MHKMWAPYKGQCYYVSTLSSTKYIVDNQTVCSPDSMRDPRPGYAGHGQRVFTPENMKNLPYGQRIVDFTTGFAGQHTRCPYFSSKDPNLTQKERNRLPVLGGFNDWLFNEARNGNPQAQELQGAFKTIHTKALQKAGKNYWGRASLKEVGQSSGYFYMITNGLSNGLVYKVNLDYRDNAYGDNAPKDNELTGKYW